MLDTNDAGGVNAAAQADANGIFAPSWKMPKGLVIGQSKATGKNDWMTYVPPVCIHYEWVSTDNPSDVTPPADDYIRVGTAYTAKDQQSTHQRYTFDGWYTNEQCTLRYSNGTALDVNTTLYGKWTTAYGNLSVTKAVSGSAGDTFKAFNFTVTLGDASVNGTFGEMTFTDGVAAFTLKHGERKTASALPAGIAYTVTEAEANQDGYTTTSDNASGNIVKDDTVTAAFTNTKVGADVTDVPSNPITPDHLPATGDTANLRLWISMMGLSLTGLVLSLVVEKKRSHRNHKI